MRVLVVRPGPAFSVQDVAHGLVAGLKDNGATVYDFRFDDLVNLYGNVGLKKRGRWQAAFDLEAAATMACEHLQAAVWRFWPDVIVLVSCFWITPETMKLLRTRPHTVVGWFTESPYEDDKQLGIARFCDLAVVNDPTNLWRFQKHCPAYYAPHSYDPAIHQPGPGRAEWRCDVAFAGTGFPSRVSFVDSVDWTGIDLRLGGMWAGAEHLHHLLINDFDECLDNRDTVTLYQSAKASFNLYRREANTHPTSTADGWAIGPREVELAATGTFFLRDPRPESDVLFPMLPTFDGPDDFRAKLVWWLDHDDARQIAAGQARDAVADRTFAATAARLLSTATATKTRRAA